MIGINANNVDVLGLPEKLDSRANSNSELHSHHAKRQPTNKDQAVKEEVNDDQRKNAKAPKDEDQQNA